MPLAFRGRRITYSVLRQRSSRVFAFRNKERFKQCLVLSYLSFSSTPAHAFNFDQKIKGNRLTVCASGFKSRSVPRIVVTCARPKRSKSGSHAQDFPAHCPNKYTGLYPFVNKTIPKVHKHPSAKSTNMLETNFRQKWLCHCRDEEMRTIDKWIVTQTSIKWTGSYSLLGDIRYVFLCQLSSSFVLSGSRMRRLLRKEVASISPCTDASATTKSNFSFNLS